MTTGGKEPNLTPFIDLFSVLTCFLLVGFSWMYFDSMSVEAESPPATEGGLFLHLLPDKLVAVDGGEIKEIQHVEVGKPDWRGLRETLGAWREKYPAKTDVVLAMDGQATYGALVKALDVLSTADFSDVGINPR